MPMQDQPTPQPMSATRGWIREEAGMQRGDRRQVLTAQLLEKEIAVHLRLPGAQIETVVGIGHPGAGAECRQQRLHRESAPMVIWASGARKLGSSLSTSTAACPREWQNAVPALRHPGSRTPESRPPSAAPATRGRSALSARSPWRALSRSPVRHRRAPGRGRGDARDRPWRYPRCSTSPGKVVPPAPHCALRRQPRRPPLLLPPVTSFHRLPRARAGDRVNGHASMMPARTGRHI